MEAHARAIPLLPPPARNRVVGWALEGSGALWLLLIPVALLVLCLLIPLATILTTALEPGLGTASETVREDLFLQAIRRTIVMAGIVALLCLIVGTVYSLGLALTSGWVRVVLFASLFMTFWISLMVRTYGWVLFLQPVGALYKVLDWLGLREEPLSLLQTTPAMYPGMVHYMLPYMILPIFAAIRSIEPSQLRAAQSLGATPLLLLRRVILPQLRNGAIAGMLLVFILSLGFFVTPRFLGGPSDLTIATIINREFSDVYDFAAASAMAFTLLVAVLILFILADRVFRVSRQWEHL